MHIASLEAYTTLNTYNLWKLALRGYLQIITKLFLKVLFSLIMITENVYFISEFLKQFLSFNKHSDNFHVVYFFGSMLDSIYN